MKLPTYKLKPDVCLETFDDGALLLKLKELTLTELNITARDILIATDGTNNMLQVAQQLADQYEIPIEEAGQDVNELYQELVEQGILETIQTPMEKEG